MYCSICGTQIPDNSKFCAACGAAVNPVKSETTHTNKKSAGKKSKGVNIPLTVLILLIVAAIVASVSFNMSIPEMFSAISKGEPLKNRDLYELQNALANYEESVSIQKDEWDSSVCEWSEMESYLRDYLQADPMLYYVDIKNTSINYYESEDHASYGIKLAYFDELTGENAKQALESAADKLLQGMPVGASDWEKALYLHDALICHVEYAEGPMDQTAYGALVEGKAVCMGYAMAYEYLLTRAEVECDTVIGYTSEFAAAMDDSLFQMAQHAWTVVTFREGGTERSYFVDTTWDDTATVDANGEEYVSHRWFCVTQEDMQREGRSVLQNGYDLDKWNLNDNSLNYYFQNDAVISGYDLDSVISILRGQMAIGTNLLTVRMADMDTYYDMSYALENGGDFQKLSEALGLSSYAYRFTYSYLGDGLLCLELFVNYTQ